MSDELVSEELGEGLDQPLLEKDEYCFFDIGEDVVLKKQWNGFILGMPKNAFELVIEDLRKQGWKEPEL